LCARTRPSDTGTNRETLARVAHFWHATGTATACPITITGAPR
jgi:hypothetical protein